MSTILHFRDLKCWQKSLELNIEIYNQTKDLKLYGLKDQIQRASLSIMNNLAEGFGRKTPKERLRFYEYSTSSCYEVESMTYLLEKLNVIEEKTLLDIRQKTIEVYKMTAALSQYIKKNSHP